MTASAAFSRTSSGPGSSGKPWPRLTASCSRARRDMTSNTETGRSAKTLFITGGRASRLGRKAGFLPRLDAAGEVMVVGQTCGLRDQRRRHRAIAGAACEDHLLAGRIGQRRGIELRHRHVDGDLGIALDVGLVRLAHIDKQNLAFGDALRDIDRVEIVYVVAPKLRHQRISNAGTAYRRPLSPEVPNRNRRPGLAATIAARSATRRGQAGR